MNTWLRVSHRPRSGGMMGSLLLAGLLLAGCGGEDTTTGYVDVPGGDTVPIVVNTPAQIAQVSADDYDDNVNGLITAATLQSWIDDWDANRPAGITGKLVILQVSNGPGGSEYITPDPLAGVITYSVPTSRWVQTRSNGVINTPSMVPDGPTVDQMLKDYSIDPTQDMIVCAMGTGGFNQNMQMGRCWYMFRYWGVRKEQLAVLNGGASVVMDGAYLGSAATCDENTIDPDVPATDCLPRTGRMSVRNLSEDNTALQATAKDVIDIAEGRVNAFLWDARSANEYTAAQGVSPGKYLGIDFRGTNPVGSAPKQGHPNGAVLLPYGNLLGDASTGFSYKPKDKIIAYLNGEEVDGAKFERFDAGSLIPLGVGGAYQPGQAVVTYCETTFRAMITGFASAAILGLPNRFYDGAMVEWNNLSSIQNKFGDFILPANSPWRTDIVTRSHFEYNTPSDINPQGVVDPYADNTNAIIMADKAYKRGTSASDGGGGGGGLPPNACGG